MYYNFHKAIKKIGGALDLLIDSIFWKSGSDYHSVVSPPSSATLKLDGVRRVWGRDGYQAQKDPGEKTAQVEVPSPLRSPSRQGGAEGTHSQTPTPEPELEKQQLASSLFVGLGSQNSVCLVSSDSSIFDSSVSVQD